MILVPFNDLDVIIDVSVLVILESLPTLLRMKDMLGNGLKTSIQGQYVSSENSSSQDYAKHFLFHRCYQEDMPYEIYTKQELRTLRGTF